MLLLAFKKKNSMFQFLITILLLVNCINCDLGNNEVSEEELILPDPLHQLEIVNGTDADEGEFPFAVRFNCKNS